MSTLLAERPALVAMMLAAFGLPLLYAWMQTGKKAAAIVGLVCLALIPVAFVIGSEMQTDREQIERLIYETADAVERNDFDRVYALIGNAEARSTAQRELPNYKFTMARVNKLRSITIVEGSFPPEADAELSVKVDVSAERGSIRDIRVVRKLLLRFEKRGDSWVVTDYQHMPIIGGPHRYSTP
jgi:hypothetical protein